MRELGGAGVAGQPEQRAAHARIPVRRAEADEGRHEIDALGGIGLVGKRPGLGGLLDDTQAVAQPLHGGAGDEDRAFQRVGALACELVGDGGEQLVFRGHRRGAGVEQREAAGAVGRLDHAGFEAGLADGGGLLVAGDAGNRDGAAEQVGHALAEFGGRILHLGQHRARHAHDLQELVVPLAGVDVEQEGARGVGGVSHMRLAAGQPPHQERVDGAERELAALGAFAGARHVVEDPGDLGAGEIGIDDQAGLFGDRGLVAFALEPGADIGGAAVLPDDGAMDRLSGSAVPHHRGLALVGDADGGDVLCLQSRLLQRVAARDDGRGPDVLRLVLDPAGGRKVLLKLLLRDGGDGDVGSEHDGARGRGALIDGQNKGHGGSSREVSCAGERTADWRAAVNMRKAEAIRSSVIASEAKQSIAPQAERWIASSLRSSQ